ncbi:flagellar transcriptional regulator FlhD [Methylomonas sp. AM2-LC]|uniref:flagellar transcriptional regulator FlhD n=1 Tax=Methylomonas sp. AM2-LC TaxID=3153301 RepID=UPI0032678235
MDEDIYNLHLDYLILAQKLVLAGMEHKAMFSLGLTQEAVAILKKLPSYQLKNIARKEILSFTPRFSAANWSSYLHNEKIAPDQDATEIRAREFLKLMPSPNTK